MTPSTLTSRFAARLSQTTRVTRFAFTRVDGASVSVLAAVVYLGAYLWATDHMRFRSGATVSVTIVDEPFARALERRSALSFEPIALIEFGIGTLLVSPIDLAIGAILAGLVGVNLALAYLALVQPKACGIGAGTGVAAAVPALLSGSVCCAPMILLVLGIQASGALLMVLPWLLPVGVMVLVGSLVYVAGLVDTTAHPRPG
ncbi:hypothetical protein ACLI4Q_08955 [Natrialbaceae archaeon A-CW1-1]